MGLETEEYLWPSAFPDLNPIENIWSIRKDSASKTMAQTEEELMIAIEDAWDNIPLQTIRNCIGNAGEVPFFRTVKRS